MSRSNLGYGFAVAAFVGVTYDWALTFGQEVELVWRQRWSLMTVLYLGVRYPGFLFAALVVVGNIPTISLTDTLLGLLMTATLYCHRCFIMFVTRDVTNAFVLPMLWVIIITRLYAMYQGSRKILIFLIVTFLAVAILNGGTIVITTMRSSGVELIFSGTHQCAIAYPEVTQLLNSISWIFGTVWEVLALCLAIWIAVKHFRELQRHSTGGFIEDCFTVVRYGSFVAVSCSHIIFDFSPTLISTGQQSIGAQTLYGFLQILEVVHTSVLGPRLILGIREYNAKLVADSDAATGMTSIAFQERVHISTSSSV
ncbi:uncharacterized protein F5891DRAFT_1179633 [Suillus fuscotomentosus]|uniref:DUF6533 domain-containing protein n=1 Tax=Suillus fuscotomentosus TaxID=1912939 RepID=A0AAD4HVC7_9AGAM|nr:uncharacterized protein F5891DRAFT_1179633 [Suillus fuscotomentosus]KAG1908114.1 hypothetical protein F5891DRAFT_1179633 [Suillus fuscotomentosus]